MERGREAGEISGSMNVTIGYAAMSGYEFGYEGSTTRAGGCLGRRVDGVHGKGQYISRIVLLLKIPASFELGSSLMFVSSRQLKLHHHEVPKRGKG